MDEGFGSGALQRGCRIYDITGRREDPSTRFVKLQARGDSSLYLAIEAWSVHDSTPCNGEVFG